MALTVKIFGDASHLNKVLASVDKNVGGLARGLGKLAGTVAKMGTAAAAAGTAFATWKIAESVKDALALGGELSDLSARTGETAGNILVLQEAFRRAGMEGVDVATILQRLAKNADLTKFAGMSLADVFEVTGKRIFAMTDKTKQAKEWVKLFGREGVKLQTLFADPTAFDTARKAVGGLADIMDRSAARFDAVDDAFGSLRLKMLQIGAAIAETALPSFERLMRLVEGADLTTAIGRWDAKTAIEQLAREVGEYALGAGEYIAVKLGTGFAKKISGFGGGTLTNVLMQTSPLAGIGKGLVYAGSRYTEANMGTLGPEDFIGARKGAFGAPQFAEAADAVRFGKSTAGMTPEVVRLMEQMQRSLDSIDKKTGKSILQN